MNCCGKTSRISNASGSEKLFFIDFGQSVDKISVSEISIEAKIVSLNQSPMFHLLRDFESANSDFLCEEGIETEYQLLQADPLKPFHKPSLNPGTNLKFLFPNLNGYIKNSMTHWDEEARQTNQFASCVTVGSDDSYFLFHFIIFHRFSPTVIVIEPFGFIVSFDLLIHRFYLRLFVLNPSGSLVFDSLAARLERKSFCEEERRIKDWEWKADKAAQILFINLMIYV